MFTKKMFENLQKGYKQMKSVKKKKSNNEKVTHFIWAGIGDNHFWIQSVDGGDVKEITAHCLQCAKAEFLAQTKEYCRVDLRGSTSNICGGFLRAMQQVVDDQHGMR
jgi:hypothetical protein